MEAVAPHIYIGYNADEFFDTLLRLIETSPEGVSSVLGKVLASNVPDYDYKGKLRSLLDILANKGKKDDAIKYAVILKDLPGIYDLFKQLDRKD